MMAVLDVSDEITFMNSVVNHDDNDGPNEGVLNQNQVLKWVQEVDSHIEESSVEIMKLGLRTELAQAEMESEKFPSGLYRKLERKYSNPEVLLSRFIYALEKLGHRRHGFRAVRKLNEFGIKKPKQFNPTDEIIDPAKVRLFNFYQCLVEICRDLKVSHYKRLSTYSTKTYLGGANPRLPTCKTPWTLFVNLLNHRTISEDDQRCLLEGLEVIGATQCIDHIHNYRHQNDLPEIGDKYCNSTRRSTASSRTDESSAQSTPRRPIQLHTISISSNDYQVESAPSNNMSSSETASRRTNQSDGYRQLRDTRAHPAGTYSSRNPHWKVCFISFLLLLVILVGVLAVAMLGTNHMMNNSKTAVYHDSATVILTEIHHFFTGSITVTQDTGYPGESDHEIGVYIVDSKCNDLPTLEQINAHTGSDLSAINKTTLYLLAGSSITYTVCESTNQTKKTGRLEVVILDNLKSTESPENIRNSFHKFAYFNVHKSDEPSCDVINHSFEANGYYTIVFLLPPYQAQFEYNVTYRIKTIDFDQLSVTANHTLYSDKESYKFPLDFSASSSCSLATIKKGLTPYLHIQFELKGHYDLWVTIFLGVVCGMTVIASLVATFVLICCCHLHSRKKQGRYNVDNIDNDQ